MDVSSPQCAAYRAPAAASADFAGAAQQDQHFPDFSIKQLIARFILARGAVVRATNPLLADEYLKLAGVFDSDTRGIAPSLNAWTASQRSRA